MTSFTFVRGAALGMIVGLALSSQTLEAASLDGGRLARRWCSACHAVSSAQKLASDAAPSFAEIARKRLTTSEIRAFLDEPPGA